MNWYKKSQQQLMFYPFNKDPDNSAQKQSPVSIDTVTKKNNYQCHECGAIVPEDEVNWYKDIDNKGKFYKLPKYDEQKIEMAFTEVAQYLMTAFAQFQEYNQQSMKFPDYSSRDTMNRWETQVPQLPSILNKYNELRDICTYKGQSYSTDICSLFQTTEINGDTLNSLSNLIQNPTQVAKEFIGYSQQQFNIQNDVPVCNECFKEFKECSSCGKPMTPDMRSTPTTWDENEVVCEECIDNGRYDVCHECGKADVPEDMHYQENFGSVCENCYQENNEEQIDWAKNTIVALDIPVGKNIPIDAKRLSNLNNFVKRYYDKYGDNILKDELERMTHLANKARMKEDDINYLNFISSSDSNLNVSDLLGNIENNIEAQNYMKEQYPQLSSYQDLPFDIDVEENYNNDKQGFTITITPSEEFFNYAETKYPDVKKVWDRMSMTPHHTGVLAYARCSYEGGSSIVINNLQRDADSDNMQSTSETAKWIDNSTKHWDVFLLNLIKSMAISQDKSAFLTTFDQQKNKWGNLPIHKSKKTYQEVPEKMGFPLKDTNVDNLIENQQSYNPSINPSMYQIANDNLNWYKKAQLEDLQQNEPEDRTMIYRGDTSNDFALHEYDLNRSIKENKKELGGIFAEGPGIYFTNNKDTASRYGEHISEINIPLSKFITPDSPSLSRAKITNIVKSFNQDTQEIASSNWDENFQMGLEKAINDIMRSDNAVDQLMSIWADVCSHQNPEEFVRIMTMQGIDGVVADKETELHYIIYNKELLR